MKKDLVKYEPATSESFKDEKGQTRSCEDKQGRKRFVTEVVGEQIILLDKKEP